jgi:hypothetical protein
MEPDPPTATNLFAPKATPLQTAFWESVCWSQVLPLAELAAVEEFAATATNREFPNATPVQLAVVGIEAAVNVRVAVVRAAAGVAVKNT